MKLTQNNDFVAQLKRFDIGTDRVDALYAGLLSNSPVYLDIWEVIRKCIVLSHGNARVEAGFSINESLLQENTKNALVVAQRIAYEGVMKEGGVLKVEINKEMLDYDCHSNGEYKAALEKGRLCQTEGEKRCKERKRLSAELNQAIAAKKNAVAEMNSVVTQHESNIHALEEQLRAT